jgi:hypothetical protein
MIKKSVFFIFLFFAVSFLNKANAQFNVIKVHHVNNVNPQILNPIKSNYNSFGMSYERNVSDHFTIELMGLYARALLFQNDREIDYVKTTGYSFDLKFKYYFQTNTEMMTYAPYGWYVSPIIGYASTKGDKTILGPPVDKPDGEGGTYSEPSNSGAKPHSISYWSTGALIGYQFILEEFEQGLVFDVALGFNYINTKGTGYGSDEDTVLPNGEIDERHKMYSFIPKIQVGFGFAF